MAKFFVAILVLYSLGALTTLVCGFCGGEGHVAAHILAGLIGFPTSYIVGRDLATNWGGIVLSLVAGFAQWLALVIIAAVFVGFSTAVSPNENDQ